MKHARTAPGATESTGTPPPDPGLITESSDGKEGYLSAKHLPPIVAFAGWPGAGKNTAAQALVAIGYREDSFAAPLKAMAVKLDPILWRNHVHLMDLLGPDWKLLSDKERAYRWDCAKSNEPAVRAYLQKLGQAVRDVLGAGVWTQALCNRVAFSSYSRTVITNCRYPNEAALVQTPWGRPPGAPGVLIWLDRDGCGPPNDHESASGVCRELADHIVSNNGTVEELHAEVLRVLGLEVAR